MVSKKTKQPDLFENKEDPYYYRAIAKNKTETPAQIKGGYWTHQDRAHLYVLGFH